MRETKLMWLKAICTVMIFVGLTGITAAQSAENGGINGRVTDTSGAVVPNVIVTATSPALQVPSVTTHTDPDGTYKLINLPSPGVYRVQFVATGFQNLVHAGVTVSVGFNARIDAAMEIGSVSQTVEVTGAAPLVDTVSTAGQTTLTQEEIATLPRGSDLQEWLPLIPGISLSGKPDVGDSNLASRNSAITYGVPLQTTLGVEGLNTTTDHGEDTAVYLDSFAFQETQFKTVGNNADVAYAGLDQIAVLKSGGNQFHGEYRFAYENPSFQSNNITAAQAAPPNNLKFSNPIISPGYYEYAGDLGGRIIRDKLWFYGGWSELALTQQQVGFHSGPNSTVTTSPYGLQYGCWTCGDAPNANLTNKLFEGNGKLSYQLSKGIKLLGVYVNGEKFIDNNGASSTQPLPVTRVEHQPLLVYNGEIQGTIGTRFLFDALFGYAGYQTNYYPQPGVAVAGVPSENEKSNGLLTGSYFNYYVHIEDRHELPASLTFIPSGSHLGGTHQLKLGVDMNWEGAGNQNPKEYGSGDYELFFNNGAPNQITIFNYPVVPVNLLHSQAVYLTDIMKINRVSLNLGVRAERYNAFYPTQSVTPKQFAAEFPAATYQGKDVLTWRDIVPRIGAAWDLRGDGKTVVKASFGMFGDTMGSSTSSHFNPAGPQTKTYNWTGPCGPTASGAPVEYQCDVTPATLSSLATHVTPDCPQTPICYVGPGGTAAQLIYPTKQDKTYETLLRVERQVSSNIAVSASYIRHAIYNNIAGITNTGSAPASTTYGTNSASSSGIIVGVPYASYNVPAVFTDALTGAPVTIYGYNTTSCIAAGCTASEILNSPSDRPDVYNTIEAVVTRNFTKRWGGLVSFWTTKDHRWIDPLVGVAGSPNDGAFPLDDTWNWEARASGTYNLRWGFQVSGTYRAANGAYGQRTEKFTNNTLLPQGTVVREMGPYGQYVGPVVSLLNLRASKTFNLGERMQLQLTVNDYNLLNSSAATSTNYLTTTNPASPTFGVITGIISPRVLRIGGQFSF